jgi:TetR/AcrR family transcriptional regulator
MTDEAPRSLRDLQRERTRAALLGAAERRFAAQGFRETTVGEIAADAAVSVRSIYNAFGGKTGLYLEVVEQALEANRRYMDQAWDPALDPLEQILVASDAYLLFHLDHHGYFQMVALPQMSSRPADDHAEVAERIARRVETEVGRVEAAIREGVRTGRMGPIDPEPAAKFLWGAWNGVIALASRPDRLRATEGDVEAILAVGRRMVLEGLAGPSARVRDGRLRADVRARGASRPDLSAT